MGPSLPTTKPRRSVAGDASATVRHSGATRLDVMSSSKYSAWGVISGAARMTTPRTQFECFAIMFSTAVRTHTHMRTIHAPQRCWRLTPCSAALHARHAALVTTYACTRLLRSTSRRRRTPPRTSIRTCACWQRYHEILYFMVTACTYIRACKCV